jgi:hypothetical protein
VSKPYPGLEEYVQIGWYRDLKPWEHREAVKKRLSVFEVRNNEILTRCEGCSKHFLVRSGTIVEALSKGKTIACCSCQDGSLLPVWKRRASHENR